MQQRRWMDYFFFRFLLTNAIICDHYFSFGSDWQLWPTKTNQHQPIGENERFFHNLIIAAHMRLNHVFINELSKLELLIVESRRVGRILRTICCSARNVLKLREVYKRRKTATLMKRADLQQQQKNNN